jgi:DNA-binding LacI/PurR family transcriptional regulator
MLDVARLAGVSHQTVSRVLNGHPNVSTGARERVESAIAQLGYHRNRAARALVTRRTMTLGVVAMDTSQYGPANTLFGIAEAARAAGYYVNLATLRRIDRPSMQAALNHLVAAAVDGIIVIAPVVAAVQAVHGLSADAPLIMAEAGEDGETSGVVVDQILGARLATRHLLDLGHETVVHVSGPENYHDAEARVRGWRDELAVARAVALNVLVGDWTPRSGYLAGKEIAKHDDVTAVFAANDQMALGLLKALREEGRSVPDDISLVGFDDIPEAAFFDPALTTIRQDFAELGRRCIDQIVALIEGASPTTAAESIPPELITRGSTAAPRR